MTYLQQPCAKIFYCKEEKKRKETELTSGWRNGKFREQYGIKDKRRYMKI
jgi:hypothetical protein